MRHLVRSVTRLPCSECGPRAELVIFAFSLSFNLVSSCQKPSLVICLRYVSLPLLCLAGSLDCRCWLVLPEKDVRSLFTVSTVVTLDEWFECLSVPLGKSLELVALERLGVREF